MSQQLATQPEGGKLRAFIEQPKVQQGIADALGGYMHPGTFLAQMLIACSNPKIEECTVASQFKAIHICATLGLLPSYQQVALIPRKDRQRNVVELTVMPQWQGLKSIMERHPDVLEVEPILVLKTDTIQFLGTAPDIMPVDHSYNPLTHVARSIDDLQGGYARITYRDGRPHKYHFVSADYIERCMRCSESFKGREKALKEKKDWVPACPWTDGWFEQQALKTILRSAYARRVVPIDPMVAGRAEAFLRQEDDVLGNDPRLVEPTTIDPPQLPAISRSAAIAGQIAQRQEATPQRQQPIRQSSAPVLPPDEPQAPVPDEPTLAAGELTQEEAQAAEAEHQAEPKSHWGEFLDLLARTRTRRDVERLQHHYLASDEGFAMNIPDDVRIEIRAALEARLAEFPANVPAKPSKDGPKQKTLA